MTAILATDCLAGLAGYINPRVSSDLRTFAVDYWPVHHADIGTSTSYAITRVVALAHGRAINAAAARSYMDDYYYRVHVLPPALALGNLLSTESRDVTVWNAWPGTTQTLNTLTQTGIDGITVTAPGVLPLSFAPLQQRVWTVVVSLTGAPVIAASLAYAFADTTQNRLVLISGNRLTVWSVPPDWANGVLERLAWLTEILQARSGEAQKRGLRISPRRTFEFDVIAEGQQRRVLDSLLADWSGRTWGLPIWPDGQVLAADLASGVTTIPVDTTHLDYSAGGLALLWSAVNSYEVVRVTSVAADHLVATLPTAQAWPRGTRIWPLRIARLGADADQTFATDAYAKLRPTFTLVEPSDWPAAWLGPIYRGQPVLELRPDEGTDPKVNYPRLVEILDNTSGLPVAIDWGGTGFRSPSQRWVLHGRTERATWRSLLYAFAGRLKNAWVPSWMSDLRLTASVLSTSAVLTVEWAGYTRFGREQLNRRDIRIELNTGTVIYRRIVTSAEVDAATEQLVLDANVGINISPAQVRAISFMALSELGSDAIEIQHETDADGIAFSPVSFKAVKLDV